MMKLTTIKYLDRNKGSISNFNRVDSLFNVRYFIIYLKPKNQKFVRVNIIIY